MNNYKNENRKQPTKYWLIEIRLTSGEFLEFYVKAINESEAVEKANDYVIIAENKQLRSKLTKFGLFT